MIRETINHDQLEHAIAIQRRRMKAGKGGYAGAVRRWLRKQGDGLRSNLKAALPENPLHKNLE